MFYFDIGMGEIRMKNSCKWLVCLLCVVFAAPSLWAKDKNTVAVLPFSVHSAENIDYVRQGIGDMLASRISVNEKIDVIGKDAVLAALRETGGKELAAGRCLQPWEKTECGLRGLGKHHQDRQAV